LRKIGLREVARPAMLASNLLGSEERFGRVVVQLTALGVPYWRGGYRRRYRRSRKEAARQDRLLLQTLSLGIVSLLSTRQLDVSFCPAQVGSSDYRDM